MIAQDNANPLLDRLMHRSMTAAAAFYDLLRDDLFKRLTKQEVENGTLAKLYLDVQNTLASYTDPLISILVDSDLAGWLNGAWEVAQLIPGIQASPVPGLASVPPTQPPLPPIISSTGGEFDWDGMETWLPLVDEAVEDLRERNLVTRDQFDLLSDAAKQRAFTVAGQATQEGVKHVYDAVVDAVQTGAMYPEFKDRVDDALETSTLGPGHTENVLRTNLAVAFNNGLDKMASHPIVAAQFPYVENLPIRDSRLTELCRVISESGIQGTAIYRRDDPVWRHFRTPRHWQDRCGTRLLSIEDAARRGIEEAKIWLETGQPPANPAYVPWPPVSLPSGWVPRGEIAAA